MPTLSGTLLFHLTPSMSRRSRKPRLEARFEAILLFVGTIVVLGVLAGGQARLPVLQAFLTIIMVALIALGVLAALGFLVWGLWRYRSHLGSAARVIPFPEEATSKTQFVSPPFNITPPIPATPNTPRAPASFAPAMPPPDLTAQFRELDWFQFEKIVALIYRKLDYQVERRGGAHADGGLDLVLRRDDQTKGVQCKHWKTWQVGVKSVREFLGALKDAQLHEGIFVSLGNFTSDAAALASRQGIRLVDARDLADLVEQAGIRSDPEFLDALSDPRKYCPKCERELILRTATRGQNLGGQFWGCSAYPRCKYILRL